MATDTDNIPAAKLDAVHPDTETAREFTAEEYAEMRLVRYNARRWQEKLLRQAGRWRDGY